MSQRGPHRTLPVHVYETIRAGFVAYEASTLISGILRDRPSQANRVQNLGDPFGKLVQPSIRLDEVLAGLRLAPGDDQAHRPRATAGQRRR